MRFVRLLFSGLLDSETMCQGHPIPWLRKKNEVASVQYGEVYVYYRNNTVSNGEIVTPSSCEVLPAGWRICIRWKYAMGVVSGIPPFPKDTLETDTHAQSNRFVVQTMQ